MSEPTTCEWASSGVTSSAVRPSVAYMREDNPLNHPSPAPVTAVAPSQDNQTYLATTLDAHARLMDMSTGKMLNDFKGHASASYRIRACFGHGEASVLCGDEEGKVWAWDLVDVRFSFAFQVSCCADARTSRRSRCNLTLPRRSMTK